MGIKVPKLEYDWTGAAAHARSAKIRTQPAKHALTTQQR